MPLEVRKNKFARHYENAFFWLLSKKLSLVFDDLKLDGVLLGSPYCTERSDLQIDALLLFQTGILIIDFKNYNGLLNLPPLNVFNEGDWIIEPRETPLNKTCVSGGSGGKNPFKQIALQREKFNQVLTNCVINKLDRNENIVTKHTFTGVCFQQPTEIKEGKVPDFLAHGFFIMDPNSVIQHIQNLIHTETNIWRGKIRGYKLEQNAFDLIKSHFLTEPFDPFQDTSIYKEFNDIEYPPIEKESQLDLAEDAFRKHKETLNQFLNSEYANALVVEHDSTSPIKDYIGLLLGHIQNEFEYGAEVFAPSNKNVINLQYQKPGYNIRSLYAELYDFEHSKIELLRNQINEREVFPLQENDSEEESVYIVQMAHLIYDFEANDEDLLKFGLRKFSEGFVGICI
jgi:hypothetical protein